MSELIFSNLVPCLWKFSQNNQEILQLLVQKDTNLTTETLTIKTQYLPPPMYLVQLKPKSIKWSQIPIFKSQIPLNKS